MLIDIQSTVKGTDLILPKLGYLTVKQIEHDYTQNPVVTTLICR